MILFCTAISIASSHGFNRYSYYWTTSQTPNTNTDTGGYYDLSLIQFINVPRTKTSSMPFTIELDAPPRRANPKCDRRTRVMSIQKRFLS